MSEVMIFLTKGGVAYVDREDYPRAPLNFPMDHNHSTSPETI